MHAMLWVLNSGCPCATQHAQEDISGAVCDGWQAWGVQQGVRRDADPGSFVCVGLRLE